MTIQSRRHRYAIAYRNVDGAVERHQHQHGYFANYRVASQHVRNLNAALRVSMGRFVVIQL